MLDSEVPAQQIQGMRPAGPCQMGEFSTVVRRQDQGVVTEVLDDPFEESDSGIAALLLIRINEAFPGSLLDDRALAEPPRNRTAAAGGGDIVHMPGRFPRGEMPHPEEKLRTVLPYGKLREYGADCF